MGKIYKVVCNLTGEIYIGSCENQTLGHRLSRHERKRDCAVSQILDRGDYQIKLIENYPCDTKEELLWRERYWFELIPCVNIRRPIVTKEEEKEKDKQYEKKHRVRRNKYQVDRNHYLKSWGFNNYLGTSLNLLDIDPTLFD